MKVPDIVQEAVIKTIPKKKKCEKAKQLSEEALQRADADWFHKDLQDLQDYNKKKRCPFHHRELDWKSQAILKVTGKFGL